MRLTFGLAAMALRRGRRKVLNPAIIEPTQALEFELAAIYLAIPRTWARAARERILPAYAGALSRTRPRIEIGAGEQAVIHLDAESDDLRNAIESAAGDAETQAEPAVESWTRRTESWHRKRWAGSVSTATGVDIAPLLDVSDVEEDLGAALQRNLGLIKNLSADMRRRIEQPIWNGLLQRSPVSKVAPQITQALGVGESRARFIASDQTAKLGADLNQLRQQQAGIDGYTWRTRRDDKVRPTHKANDGKRFAWVKPPVVTGHPGHDVNCRCVAEPYIDIEAAVKEVLRAGSRPPAFGFGS